jgi:hypothetical protein
MESLCSWLTKKKKDKKKGRRRRRRRRRKSPEMKQRLSYSC